LSKTKVAVLDYGIGNVRSIVNAFLKIGAAPVLTSERNEVLGSDILVLPGVGAFGEGMKNLNESNLIPLIHDFVDTGKPFLGICLGMQMLLEKSEEFGYTPGLGLIKGKVVKMPTNFNKDVKLPHVGWNEIRKPSQNRWDNTFLSTTVESSDVYFVHTFMATPDNLEDTLAIANYCGVDFCAAVQHKNVYGTQFHPEKSGPLGLQMLKRFIELLN
jgi:imidazole glycerol-phosphate synthase subunit HisH